MVLDLYLLMFVGVAQAFMKIPVLEAPPPHRPNRRSSYRRSSCWCFSWFWRLPPAGNRADRNSACGGRTGEIACSIVNAEDRSIAHGIGPIFGLSRDARLTDNGPLAISPVRARKERSRASEA
jgi:hypothetical protein